MIGETFANLQIIREIGHGGMGVVYEAQQQAPQRRVAVKVLPPHLAAEPGVAARFADEANKMARLEGHPNIAQVYAAGQSDGVPYLVMQLLRGDLDQRLRTHGALPLSDAAELAAQVADGLDYAHERGVIHRDIKPANIMFDERGRPVVTDFGIAKAMDEYRLTSTGMTLGTPQYASPEQVRGNPLDGRSDLYSLGIVLYEMVTGRLPFQSDTPMGFAMQHLQEPPRRPGDLVAGMPAGLERIILRCLAKDPSQRFNNGRDLAAALRAQALPRVILRPGYTPPLPQPQQTSVMSTPPVPPRSRISPLIIVLASVGAIALIVGLIAFGAMLSSGGSVYSPPGPPPGYDTEHAVPGQQDPPHIPIDRSTTGTQSPGTGTNSEGDSPLQDPKPPSPPPPPAPADPPEDAVTTVKDYLRLCNSGDCSGVYGCFSALKKSNLSYTKYQNQVFDAGSDYTIRELGSAQPGCNPDEALVPLSLAVSNSAGTSYWSGDVTLVREDDTWKIEIWGLEKE